MLGSCVHDASSASRIVVRPRATMCARGKRLRRRPSPQRISFQPTARGQRQERVRYRT